MNPAIQIKILNHSVEVRVAAERPSLGRTAVFDVIDWLATSDKTVVYIAFLISNAFFVDGELNIALNGIEDIHGILDACGHAIRLGQTRHSLEEFSGV
jgi:hypothetical protein